MATDLPKYRHGADLLLRLDQTPGVLWKDGTWSVCHRDSLGDGVAALIGWAVLTWDSPCRRLRII